MEHSKTIGIQAIPGGSTSTGIGYVYLSQDVDRDLYVKNCFSTNTVTLITENREIYPKTPIGKLAIQFIDFPNNFQELGSPVSFIIHPTKKKPIITDVYDFSSVASDIGEFQYSFRKTFGENIVNISADAKSGSINMLVDAENSDQGKLNITISNVDKTGQLNIEIFGDGNIMATSTINLRSFTDTNILAGGNMNLRTSQIFDIFASQIAQIRPVEKFILGLENEAMVLGNILQTFLDTFIDEVAAITTATMIGTQPIINAAQVTALKQQTVNILSQYGFLKNNENEIEDEELVVTTEEETE